MQVLRRRLDITVFMLLVLIPAMLTLAAVNTTVMLSRHATMAPQAQLVSCVPIARPGTATAHSML